MDEPGNEAAPAQGIDLFDLLDELGDFKNFSSLPPGLRVHLYQEPSHPVIKLGGDIVSISHTYPAKGVFRVFRTSDGGEFWAYGRRKQDSPRLFNKAGEPYIELPAANFGEGSQARLGLFKD